MFRRWRARRKMRWAVRRLRSMTPQHRQLFQLHSLQRRWRRDLELIAAKRRELYGDDPWGASTLTGRD